MEQGENKDEQGEQVENEEEQGENEEEGRSPEIYTVKKYYLFSQYNKRGTNVGRANFIFIFMFCRHTVAKCFPCFL